MPTPPADPALMPPPVNATEWVQRPASAQRRWLMAATIGIIVLMLLGMSAFLWREHRLALDKAGDRAQRFSQRIAQDLEQTLKVARTVIRQVDAQLPLTAAELPQKADHPLLGSYSTLLASLPLPFDLHAIGAQGRSLAIVSTIEQPPGEPSSHVHHDNAALPAERWSLDLNSWTSQHDFIPLAWKAGANTAGVHGYGVDLSVDALNNWLARDRIETDDRVSLFWLNGNGTATLLIRAPAVPGEIGQQIRAPWVDAAHLAPSGEVDQLSVLDGMPRRVEFQRLSGAADRLVVVYGAGTRMALAEWRAELPYFLGLVLFVAGIMSYGAWRLDRSLKALTRSERNFQLVLDSGQAWEWDIANNRLRFAPAFLKRTGSHAQSQEGSIRAFLEQVLPEDVDRLKNALAEHFKTREPYHLMFRMRDQDGNVRWLQNRGQAFWDANGRAQYMAGTTFDVTERIALEEVQRQTLQRLDIVANASPVLFCTSDLHGEVNWLNRRWLAFTGRTAEQEMGQGWLDGVHPEDLPRKHAFFGSVNTRRDAVSTEFRLRDKEGVYRWMVVQRLPLTNADRSVTGFIVSCVDISELRHAEAAARERGAMLEAVFNVLEDSLFIIDQNGRFVHFEGTSDQRLHGPSNTFIGKQVQEVLHAPIAQLIQEHLKRAESGQLQEFDYLLTLPDGEHHFDARMARLPGSAHYMVVARDITERDLLRQQQQRQQQFMALQARLSTNFINLPIHQIDTGIGQALAEVGTFAQTDRAYIFEYDFANQQTSNTHEWCAPNVQSELNRLQNIGLETIPAWVEAHRRREQIYIPDVLLMEAGPIRDALAAQGIRSLITLPMNTSEECIGFVGFDSVSAYHEYSAEQIGLLRLFAQMLVNVHSRKSADTRLQRLTAELEQRVEERTAQLDISVRRLSQANQELESFAYSVSHDLKAPLRSVEGFASLLLNEHSARLDTAGRDYLGRIQQAALHMAHLISDLLAYCRIEEFDKEIAPVSLLDTVNDVLDGMRNELEAREVNLHLSIPPHLTILAHPQGLAMVLRNLLDNAIKFRQPDHPPDITLTACADSHRTRLCVKDQGLGFDMRYHDRIFAIFQRLHRPETIPGTGIGLAMVYKAVQRMNGQIWAESQPGQGAKLHIELPSA